MIILASLANADPIRIATYNTELSRKGPGLLLRDIQRGKDKQIAAVVQVIDHVNPDIIALQNLDWDYENAALIALNGLLDAPYPFHFSKRPNTGMATDLDLDGDGRTGKPGDAQGFGDFSGQGGMAMLSRLPIEQDNIVDLSEFLWRDLLDANLPTHKDGSVFPSAKAMEIQRLSSTGHWAVPIHVSDGLSITMLIYHATPPVFDGPEDQNGRRNADELRLWQAYTEGELDFKPPNRPWILIGDANLDPYDGGGRSEVLREFLAAKKFFDPMPGSDAGALAGKTGAANENQRGDPRLDTADWGDTAREPGNLRVDYVLPTRDLHVISSGVFWPTGASDAGLADVVARASRHRMVWVDVMVQRD